MADEELKPLESNEVAVVVAGMIAWAVALVLLATVFRHDLQRHHATWWLWSCVLGLLLGLYGLRFALRRRRRPLGVGDGTGGGGRPGGGSGAGSGAGSGVSGGGLGGAAGSAPVVAPGSEPQL